MLSLKRHLGETILIGERVLVTIKQICHDGLHRSGVRLLVQTPDSALLFWLYKGDALILDNGAIRIEPGKIGTGRVRMQVEAEGLAIEWPKPIAPPAPPPAASSTERPTPPAAAAAAAEEVGVYDQLLSSIVAARAGGAL